MAVNKQAEVAGIAPPCEHCGSSFSTITDKRGDSEYNRGDIYRRRECLECGGRFTTYEIGMGQYQAIREDHRLRRKGVKMFNNLHTGESLDRFKNLGIIEREPNVSEMWNHPTFVLGIHYGALLALAEVFKLKKGDLQQ